MSISRRLRIINETAETESLINAAETGDIIQLCRVVPDKTRNDSSVIAPSFRPSIRGIVQHIWEDGFYLNGEKWFSYTGECKDWYPYLGKEIIVINDNKLIRLYHEKNSAGGFIQKKEEIKQLGAVSTTLSHLATETLVVDDEEFGTLHINEFEPHVGKIGRAKSVAGELMSSILRKPITKKLSAFSNIGLYWSKTFATRHIQPLQVPIRKDRGEVFKLYSMNDPRGMIYLNKDNKFVRIFPGIAEEVYVPKKDFGRLKWEMYNGNLLTEESDRIYLNEDPDNPCYVGEYDEVHPAGQSFLIRKGNTFYKPFEQTWPLAKVLYHELIQHPHGLLVIHDSDCSLIVVK